MQQRKQYLVHQVLQMQFQTRLQITRWLHLRKALLQVPRLRTTPPPRIQHQLRPSEQLVFQGPPKPQQLPRRPLRPPSKWSEPAVPNPQTPHFQASVAVPEPVDYPPSAVPAGQVSQVSVVSMAARAALTSTRRHLLVPTPSLPSSTRSPTTRIWRTKRKRRRRTVAPCLKSCRKSEGQLRQK